MHPLNRAHSIRFRERDKFQKVFSIDWRESRYRVYLILEMMTARYY